MSPRRRQRRPSEPRQRGFTLIELLIAIAVFAVMAAMAYSGLSSVLDSREGIERALDRSKTLQLAVWRLRQDIEQVVNRPVRDSFGDTLPALTGSPELGIELTRNGWRNPLGEPRSHLQRVAYRINEDNDLVRAYWRVLDRAQDSQTVDSVVLEDVSNVEWRYLDRDRRWQDRWPPNSSPGASTSATTARASEPPLAVELNVTTQAWGELRLLFMIPGAQA